MQVVVCDVVLCDAAVIESSGVSAAFTAKVTLSGAEFEISSE